MRVASDGLIIHRDINSTKTSLATTIQVGAHVHIEHQVPYQHSLTPLVNSAQSNVLHILHKALREVTTIVPCANARLREDEFLVRSLGVDVGQLGVLAAVVVIGRSNYQL